MFKVTARDQGHYKGPSGAFVTYCNISCFLFQPCTSQDCVKESAYILNKMQTTVDPCTDFYEFACGKWEKSTHIPPSKSRYGAFTQISDQIKDILKEVIQMKASI